MTTAEQESSANKESSVNKKSSTDKEPLAEKKTSNKKQPENKTNDVSTFLSDLNTAIDFRSSKRGSRDAINRFYYTAGSTNILLEQNLNVENITKRAINKIPHCQEWHEGIISIRGTIVPVINMKKFLQGKVNIEAKSGDNKAKKNSADNEDKNNNNNNEEQFLLMTHPEHKPIVFLIDKLPEMVNIKDYTREKKPKKALNWHTRQLIGNNITIVEANHNKLLKQIIKEQ